MNKVFLLGFFIALFGFTSCDLGDDEDMECVTGPVIIALDLLEEESGMNLFQNGTFQQTGFTAINDLGTAVEHDFLVQDGRPYLRLRLPDNSGERVITLNLNSETTLNIKYTMAAIEGNCISYRITEFDIPGYDFEQSSTTGVITVFF